MKVKTLVILPAILVAIVLVFPVSGYQYRFIDGGELDDWYSPVVVTPDGWNYCLRYDSAFGVGTTEHVWNTRDYPTNYWAFTTLPGSTLAAGIYAADDLGHNWIMGSAGSHGLGRYEIVRTGTVYDTYLDGVWVYNATSAYIPHTFYIYQATTVDKLYFDDFVVGTSEERNLITTIPNSWFCAKDIIDPGFNGLYSSYGVLNNANNMYCRYAIDGGNGTITMRDPEGNVVNTTSISSSYSGSITYNATTILYSTSAPYGIYTISIDGTSAVDTFSYQAVSQTGTTVDWDNSSYIDDEIAVITYSIGNTYWVTDDYRYYLKVLASDLTVMESWEITSQPTGETQNITIDSTNFPISGTYYTCLYAQDRSSLEDILMVYDEADVVVSWGGANGVDIEGTTYDAINSTALGSCTVTATQLGTPHPTTSNPTDGEYSITGLDLNFAIGVNATKTGWQGFPTYFTPYSEGVYTIDVPLIPSGGPNAGDWNEDSNGWYTDDSSSPDTTDYYNSTTDGTGCGGLIYNEPYWSATSGSTVTISNASWNASVVTGNGGWWQFNETTDGVCGGAYTLTCSKTGYETLSCTITCVEDEFTRKDACLGTNFTLTVNCRELTSHGLVTDTDCYVELDSGASTTTTTGVATFTDVDYGVVDIDASAVGYYPGTASCVVDSDTTETCYLQSESSSPTNNTGMGVGYPPKTVRFTVQTIWGAPIEDVMVNCTGYETTVGSWDWLYSLFGVDCNETPIANTSMGGYTDYKGDIVFTMFEPVKYNCSFVKTGECNETLSIYPKDEEYIVIAGSFGNTSMWIGGEDLNEAVTCNVTTSIIDPTHANITCNYLDTSGDTTGGTVFLNQTNPLNRTGPEITLDTYVIPDSEWNCTFSVTDHAGESYFVRVQPTHSTWSFERDFSVTFPENQVNPLNLTDTELMFIAVFIILFTGLLFGAISAPHAPLVMCFLGWIFLAFGWMDAIAVSAVAVLTLASVLAVLNLVMVRSKKERYI